MSESRQVLPVARPRCPDCHAFVSVKTAIRCISDYVWCSACCSKIHISKLGFDAPVNPKPAVFDTTPEVNSRKNYYSNLFTNGKSKKILNRPPLDLEQLSFFRGAQ